MNAILMNNAIALDSSIEHEINADGHGMTVILQYKDGTIKICQNVTEVHWRFKSEYTSAIGPSVAIESDIHREGFTHPISDIVLCTIRPADMKHSRGCVYR